MTSASLTRGFVTVFTVTLCVSMTAPQARGLDVDEIVKRHTEALGGEAQLSALKSLRLVGKISFGNGDSSIELRWTSLMKRPGRIRQEASLQGMTGVFTYDGKEGWQVQPFEGRRDPEHTSPDDSKELAQQADFEGPVVNWKTKGFSVAYLGPEDVDGTAALKLKVTRPTGDFEYLFLDPAAFLAIRSEKHNFVRGTEQISEIDYGNYEQVGGVWLPFAVESGAKAQPRSQRVTIERAEPNPEFADSLFEFPKSKDAVKPTPAPPADAPNQVKPGSSTRPQPVGGAKVARLDAGVVSGLGGPEHWVGGN